MFNRHRIQRGDGSQFRSVQGRRPLTSLWRTMAFADCTPPAITRLYVAFMGKRGLTANAFILRWLARPIFPGATRRAVEQHQKG